MRRTAPPPRVRRAALLLALLALPVSPAGAQGVSSVPRAAWWGGAAILLGASVALDQEIRSTIPPGGGTEWEPLADRLNALGNPRYIVPVLAGGYAVGRIAPSPELSAASAHVLLALVAGGIANGTLKAAIGRERPAGADPASFRPLNLNNRWQSFPSGHSVVAFSVATALAGEAGRPWVSAFAYGTASLVSWSRVYEDKHWTSDVVGGSLVGIATARASLALLHRLHPHGEGEPVTVTLLPGAFLVRLPAR